MSTSSPTETLNRNLLTTIVLASLALSVRSASSQFVLNPVPGLPPVASGSVAWNVRIGTAPGDSSVVSTPALTNGKLLVPRLGSVRKEFTVRNLAPGQTYYWSVQAVDLSFAGSPFATEQQFSTSPLIVNAARPANRVFEFEFTNRTALSFDILASTNPTLPLTDWINLGPAMSLGGGLHRFTDAAGTDPPQRFYRLRAQ